MVIDALAGLRMKMVSKNLQRPERSTSLEL